MDKDLLKLYTLWMGVLCIGAALTLVAVLLVITSFIH